MKKLEYLGKPEYQPKSSIDSEGRRLFPYLPHPDLVKAVNLAIALERPLLLQGEPGCGKTLLARSIAYEFGQRYLDKKDEWPYFRWNITSRTQVQQGHYTYDSLARLRDAQIIGSESLQNFMDEEQKKRLLDRVNNPESYMTWGELGKTYRESNYRSILLLDEIDKADIDFPNDLLAELEEPRFTIIETQREVIATHKPIVIITSNNERELPEAFLRRCLFYYLEFPDDKRLQEIIKLHFSEEQLANLRTKAVDTFLAVRSKGLGRSGSKKASTSELIDWLRYLTHLPLEKAEEEIEKLERDPAQLGILLKSKVDIDRLLFSKPS